MQFFLYEHVTASGRGEESLLREGDAMVRSLAADFATLPKMKVLVARHPKLPPLDLGPRVTCIDPQIEHAQSPKEMAAALHRLNLKPDWALVLAPEIDMHMSYLAMIMEPLAKRCLHPFVETVAIATEKFELHERLKLIEAPTPRSWRPTSDEATLPADWPFPSVIKPLQGAGSLGVRLVESREQFEKEGLGDTEFLQEYVQGTPVSVACLCMEKRIAMLEPCLQVLGGESGFEYLGGRTPLGRLQAARASTLAELAIAALQYRGKSPRGYIGVDLVLGEATNGTEDYIIEVNPRITTSYVGLRKYYQGNLAGAMIDIAQGRQPKLSPRGVDVEWDSAGNVVVTKKN